MDGYGDNTSNNSVYTEPAIDSMYYPGKSRYYWLASPSARYADNVMRVDNSSGGNVYYNSYSNLRALCPVVSLKFNAQLQLQ